MSKPLKPAVQIRPFFMVLVVIGCAVILVAYSLPSLTRGGPSIAMKIVRNLRKIELAKQMWAEDHSGTNSAQVSKEALAAYFPNRLKSGELVPSIAGERYIINSVGVAPEAQLAHKLGKWPEGTIIRLHLSTNRLFEILLPNEQGGADERQPVSSETNPAPVTAASRRSP